MKHEKTITVGQYVEEVHASLAERSTEPPVCVEVVDADVINQWFDFWLGEDATSDRCGDSGKSEIINKLRRLALAGARKGRRNNKAVAEVLADVLDGMAADVRAGEKR